MTFGINGAELIILVFLAVMVLGPEKLPEYTRKLTEFIRNLRSMAEGAKSQFKEETGTDFDEIDWRRYDPRQYDPRRIIRDALSDPADDAGPGGRGAKASGAGSTAALDPGTREALREDLDAVRSGRDSLREDLKDLDPRALFFGSSSARRSSGEGEGDPEAAGTKPAAPASSGTEPADLGSAHARPADTRSAGPGPALAAATGAAGSMGTAGTAVPATAAVGVAAPESPAPPVPAAGAPEAAGADHRPTPFDAEAT